jgi:hypothetical protein
MLRGLVVAACVFPACASHAPAGPPARAAAGDPSLALSALVSAPVESTAAGAARRPRRVGRLSAPFALGAPARNVLARAASDANERDVAAR